VSAGTQRELPSGTVTFLFTDMEGSTRLLQTLGEKWPAILEAHNDLLRGAIREVGGIDLRTEGDALFAVFRSAPAAAGRRGGGPAGPVRTSMTPERPAPPRNTTDSRWP
jgi:class 3 adenylate cyclase